MPILFLSHSGPDTAAAIDLKRRLLASPDAQAAGLTVWLDVDDLDEGKPWQPQLEAAIGTATAFAVVVGSAGVRNWVRAETDIALSRAVRDESFRLIPILQDVGSEHLSPFVKRYHAVRNPLTNPDAMQRLLRAALGQDSEGLPVLTDAPFPGLRSMTEDWADRFFGRIKETDEVLALLRRHRAVTIVADSGAGKSSLAMAGVGHAWRGGAFRVQRPRADAAEIWHVVTMRPAENPVEQLRNGIETAAREMGRDDAAVGSYRGQLTTDPAFALRCGLDPAATRTLLIIDQAEELVTTVIARDRRGAFGRLIADLAEAMGHRLHILVTVRSDHLNLVTGVDGLGPMIRPPEAQFPLKQPVDLAEIVRGPLALAGHRDDAEQTTLIGLLRKDLSDRPGHLALAQMTLSLAWRDRGKHGGLLAAYAANGGARAALGNEATRIESELSPEDTARLMPIFIRLIRLSEIDTGATRRIAARTEFDDAQNHLIDRLAGADFGRLVQTSATHVEVSHEALITQWPQLHGYLVDHAAGLRTLADLMRRAADWEASGNSTKHLTSLADEERFQALRNEHDEWLAPLEQQFLDWSLAEHQRIQSEQQAADQARTEALKGREIAIAAGRRAIRTGLAAAGVLLLTLLGAGWFAYDRDTRAAQSRVDALALLALSQAEADPVGALKLVLSAWPSDASGPFPTSSVAFRAVSAAFARTRPHEVLRGDERQVRSVAFSPDGRRIVSGGLDGTLRLWDATTGAAIGEPLRGHEDWVWSVAFSPDGRRIVSGGYDGALRLWDATTGAAIGEPLRGHEGEVTSVAFSPDGRRIVSGGFDGTLRLWDATTGAVLGEPLRGHKGWVFSVAFAPDGRRIVSGGEDGILRLWDATTGAAIGEPMRGHEDWVRSVALSPDGRRIVSGGHSGTLRLWDATTGAVLGEPLRGHEGLILSVAFSPDGRRIVSGGMDGTLRLWDDTTGAAIDGPLRGHEGGVRSVAFSPDGRRIVSGGSDGTLRLWDATTGAAIGELPRGHERDVNTAAFSPDGRRIVTWGDDGTLGLWDPTTGPAIGEPLRGHEDWVLVLSLAFSPNGRRIVSGGFDGMLRLWDATTGAAIGEPLRGHEGWVTSVAFSPDGRRIVSGGRDGTLRLWDAATGAALGEPLRGHEDWVWSVAFSPDGRRIVSGGSDRTLRLWDATTGAAIGEPLRGHDGWVWSVAFSPDGRRIVSGGEDGTIRLWGNLPPGNILQVACRYLPRINGRPDTSTDGLAAEIGITGLTLPAVCDSYDPPMPPELMR